MYLFHQLFTMNKLDESKVLEIIGEYLKMGKYNRGDGYYAFSIVLELIKREHFVFTEELLTQFIGYAPYVGELPRRSNGVMVSGVTGTTMAYSLQYLEDRGTLLVGPSVEVYEGQIVGINNMSNDLTVNPIKNKNLTSVRSANTDEAVKVSAHRVMSLEEALEFIEDDELVEITPDAIRLRKKNLTKLDRRLAFREEMAQGK